MLSCGADGSLLGQSRCPLCSCDSWQVVVVQVCGVVVAHFWISCVYQLICLSYMPAACWHNCDTCALPEGLFAGFSRLAMLYVHIKCRSLCHDSRAQCVSFPTTQRPVHQRRASIMPSRVMYQVEVWS